MVAAAISVWVFGSVGKLFRVVATIDATLSRKVTPGPTATVAVKGSLPVCAAGSSVTAEEVVPPSVSAIAPAISAATATTTAAEATIVIQLRVVQLGRFAIALSVPTFA